MNNCCDSYGNANVAAFLPLYGGNILANVITGNLATGIQPNITVVGPLTGVTTTGNIRGAGNLVVTSDITTTVGNLYVPAGSIFVNNTVVANGIIFSSSNIVTDTTLVAFDADVSNRMLANSVWSDNFYSANGQPYLPTYSGNITADTVSATGNITGGNLLTGGLLSVGGNILANNISALGNITIGANGYFVGNGAYLTGINANLSGNLSGNILANGFYIKDLAALSVNGTVLANAISTTGNIVSNTWVQAANGIATGNVVNATGNVAITANAQTWQFDTAGSLTLPLGSAVNETPAGLTVTLDQLTAAVAWTGTLVFSQQSVTQYQALPGGPTMDLDTGTGIWTINYGADVYYGSTDLITWTQGPQGTLPEPVGTVSTAKTNLTNNSQTWQFDSAGVLTAPGNIAIGNNYFLGNGRFLTGLSTALGGNLTSNISANGFFINNLTALSVNGNIQANTAVIANVYVGNTAGNLILQPNSANTEALDIYLTTANDIHITGGASNVIIGTDSAANVDVNNTGRVTVRANALANGQSQTWVFDTQGGLSWPLTSRINETPRAVRLLGTQTNSTMNVVYVQAQNGNYYSGGYNVTANAWWIEFDINTYYLTYNGSRYMDSTDLVVWNLGPVLDPAIETASTGQEYSPAINIETQGNVWRFGGDATLITPGNVVVTGSVLSQSVSASGNIQGNNIITVNITGSGNVVMAGNITGNNLSISNTFTGRSASLSGNVTATYYFGDGSQLTGIAPTVQVYEFANVSANVNGYFNAVWLANYTAGNIANVSSTVTTTAVNIASFITQPGYPGITVIPTGAILTRIETKKDAGPQGYHVYTEIYRRNQAGVETFIVRSDDSTTITQNTTVQQNLIAYIAQPVTIAATDRIITKIYAYMDSGTASIQVSFDDNTGSGLQLPALPASASQFVPYNNATANVNLGTYGLSAQGNIYGGNLSTFYGTTVTGNVTTSMFGNIAGNVISAQGNIYGNNISASGNVLANNISTFLGTTVTGNVVTSLWGNINAGNGYVFGNGALLSGINGIANGTSNIGIFTANGNILMSVANTANVVSISNTAISLTGNIITTGNATIGNITTFYGTTTTGNVTTSLFGNIDGNAINAQGNITGGNISIAGNVLGGNLSTFYGTTTTGNVTTSMFGNIAGNVISAQGNIYGNNISVTGTLSVASLTGTNLSLSGNITAADIVLNYANTLSYPANAIVNNAGTLYRASGNVAANTTFALGNVANTWTYVKTWSKPATSYWIDPLNGDDSNDGSSSTPIKTFAKLLTFANLNSGCSINLLPGTYSENVTWTQTNINFNGMGTVGGLVNITGNWTFNNPPSSVRWSGVTFVGTVDITGTGSVYFDTTNFGAAIAKSGSGYVEFVNSSINSTLSITGAGQVYLRGSLYSAITTNNASAFLSINSGASSGGAIAVTSGTLYTSSTNLVGANNTTPVLTLAAGTTAVMRDTMISYANGTVGNITVGTGALYSFQGLTYNRTTSTNTGTNLAQTFQVDTLYSVGNISSAGTVAALAVSATGNVNAGNISVSGNITTKNITTFYGTTTTGNVTTSLWGNVNAGNGYVLGNGSLLTGIPGGTFISNGTSNIGFAAANGNILMSVANTANVVLISNTTVSLSGNIITAGNANIGNITTFLGTSIAGNVTVSLWGNIDAGNGYVLGNGSLLTGLSGYSISNGTSNVGIFTANGNITMSVANTANVVTISNTSISLTGNIITTGNANIGNITTFYGTTVTGNVTTSLWGNINVGNGYVIGNGSQLTGIGVSNGTSTINIPSVNGNINFIVGNVVTGYLSANTVSWGNLAGAANNGGNAVAIGFQAGRSSQGSQGIAIGYTAGLSSQGGAAIAIGTQAGYLSQSSTAVAIGSGAGQQGQSANAIAIGTRAAQLNQGLNSIAIGALAGDVVQPANSIILNATGTSVNTSLANSLFINPIRNVQANVANILFYNADTKEVSYANTISIAGNIISSNMSTFYGTTTTGNVTTSLYGNVTTGNINIIGNISIGGTVLGGIPGIANGTSNIGFANANGAIIMNVNGTTAGNINVNSLALGYQSATTLQGNSAVAIGQTAGYSAQGNSAVALGYVAGYANQGVAAVAVGLAAGYTDQGNNAISIGSSAGFSLQGIQSVAVGYQAGTASQSANAVAVGTYAGRSAQGENSVAIGWSAGNSSQNSLAVSIGYLAGASSQGLQSVAIGAQSGRTNQGSQSVAIGYQTAINNQGTGAIAIGQGTASGSQGCGAIAIGKSAALSNQGANAIAIGVSTGDNSGINSVVIGYNIGGFVGANSVAIGANIATALGNVIAINGTGQTLNANVANALYISPVRYANTLGNAVYYNTATREMYYGNVESIIQNGTSNVAIATANGAVTISANSVANVVTVAANLVTFGANTTVAYANVSNVVTANATLAYYPLVLDSTGVVSRQPVVATLSPVIDNTLTTPPASPAINDAYLIPATGATGAWAGQGNKIATWTGSAWSFYTPVTNDQTSVLSGTNAGNVYLYTGTAWTLQTVNTGVPIYNWALASSYTVGTVVLYQSALYQANGAIPANTAFVVGTTGATWKSISGSSSIGEFGNVQVPLNTTIAVGSLASPARVANVTVPSSGTWTISPSVRFTSIATNGYGGVALYYNSNNAQVGNSVTLGVYGTGTQATASADWQITTSGATAYYIGAYGVNSSVISDTNGYSQVSYNKISGFLPVTSGVFTSATIPSAVTSGMGARAYVTDATSTTFNAAYVGGSTNKVPVVSNGTAWFIG